MKILPASRFCHESGFDLLNIIYRALVIPATAKPPCAGYVGIRSTIGKDIVVEKCIAIYPMNSRRRERTDTAIFDVTFWNRYAK